MLTNNKKYSDQNQYYTKRFKRLIVDPTYGLLCIFTTIRSI
jgi:hypothetical protein